MASPKNEEYSRDDIMIARFAKALSHPARVAILKHLASLETCCFQEISREIPLADSTVSQHLAELRKAGLIQGSIEAPRIKYCINWKNWQLLRKALRDFAEIKIQKYENEYSKP